MPGPESEVVQEPIPTPLKDVGESELCECGGFRYKCATFGHLPLANKDVMDQPIPETLADATARIVSKSEKRRHYYQTQGHSLTCELCGKGGGTLVKSKAGANPTYYHALQFNSKLRRMLPTCPRGE